MEATESGALEAVDGLGKAARNRSVISSPKEFLYDRVLPQRRMPELADPSKEFLYDRVLPQRRMPELADPSAVVDSERLYSDCRFSDEDRILR